MTDHTERTAQAMWARFANEEARRRGDACEACEGTHIVETDRGCVQCPTCSPWGEAS